MTDAIEAENQEYFRLVQLLLLDFQFIEEGLKIYIATAYEIVRIRTRGFITFALDYGTVAQEPFGRLIARYSPLTENKPLVQRLKRLQTARNHTAHRAFLLTYEEQHDSAFLSGEISRLGSLRQETNECVHQVLDEVKALHEVRARADGSV